MVIWLCFITKYMLAIYDWCLVKWVDNDEQHDTCPGKILGFFSIHNLVYAVI
jgi:hypothetical protein